MASSGELARAGRLDEALAAAQEAVRAAPGDRSARTALIGILCVLGAWDRAARQLEALGALAPEDVLATAAYRMLVGSETLRARIFAGEEPPHGLGQPPAWFALLAEALRQDAAGQHAAAAELRARALAEAPTTAAEADGEPVSGIRDTDERLGPVLEVVVNGHYHWLPFAHLRRLEIDPPRRLLDLVWCKVRLTLANGANLGGFIPVRYPGSEASDDPGFRLSRRTEWFRLGEDGSEVALGARTFTSDQGDRALLDLRELVLAGSAPVEI